MSLWFEYHKHIACCWLLLIRGDFFADRPNIIIQFDSKHLYVFLKIIKITLIDQAAVICFCSPGFGFIKGASGVVSEVLGFFIMKSTVSFTDI
jgi:hypothetical protein